MSTKLYSPMLAKPSSIEFLRQVEDDLNWVAVTKWDGYREQLHLSNEGNHLYSRYGNDHIVNCPQFQTIIPELDGTVLDCEGMSPTGRLEDNAACFKAHSENAIAWQKVNGSVHLVVFDILAYRGGDVTGEPFSFRRALLEKAFLRLDGYGLLSKEQLVSVDKEQYCKDILAEGGEGVILKSLKAPYSPGKRTNAWLKVKRLEQYEYYICGFLPAAEGKFEGLVGSVMYTDSPSNPVIGASSGMDDATRQHMTSHSYEYLGKLAKFDCQQITRRGVMRHPRYRGLVDV